MKNIINNAKRFPLIVAEIGQAHEGSVGLAHSFIDAIADCGADAVKFQTFSAERLASIDTPKVKYQLQNTSNSESHYEMLKKLELSPSSPFCIYLALVVLPLIV